MGLTPEQLATRAAESSTMWSIRALLLHMVEEYTRHLGHADLLRARVDGRLGE